MADILQRIMSTEEQRNEPGISTPATGGSQLTAANLAAHNRNTPAMPPGHAIRSWLNDTGTPSGRHVDGATWAVIVDGDPMAADMEAALRGGNQNGAGQE